MKDYKPPTAAALKQLDFRAGEGGFMGGSLVDRAIMDVMKVNKTRSEMNTAGSALRAGQMFKTMDMASKIGGMFMMNPLAMAPRIDCGAS